MIAGDGITNTSSTVQNFVTAAGDTADTTGLITFQGNSTIVGPVTFTNQPALVDLGPAGSTQFVDQANAGGASFYNYPSQTPDQEGPAGTTVFSDQASAGTATFTNYGNFPVSFFPAYTSFNGSSTADHATFINLGTGVASGGKTYFNDSATAANATFINSDGAGVQFSGLGVSAGNSVSINNGATVAGDTVNGGQTTFYNFADAGTATLIANGGSNGGKGGNISFSFGATGPNATIMLYGNGTLTPPPVIGSLEGDGIVVLHDSTAIGNNNKDTTFGGSIQQFDPLDFFGSVEKVGSGTLTLTGASSYRGGTTVSAGALIVDNQTGSATGRGRVTVAGGILGGTGAISGPTAIGIGDGGGATLEPRLGKKGGVPLAFGSLVFFKADSTYIYDLDAKRAGFAAQKVTIDNRAQFVARTRSMSIPPVGTVYTAIKNNGHLPIEGTFADLPDGGTVVLNGINLQTNYAGGDGNDLTLTVE